MLALISSKTEKAYHEREEIATAIALTRESERRHRVCLSIWTIWPSNSQPFPMVFDRPESLPTSNGVRRLAIISRVAGLTRSQLIECSEPRSLTRNCLEALDELHSKGLVVAIISGGIHKFVRTNSLAFGTVSILS